jgi:polyferredoxin
MWTIAHGMTNEAARRLQIVKLLHTVAWVVFAGCIVAIPWLTWHGQFGVAAVLATIVFGEVVVLWYHRWNCPLTAIAARYTDDRRANFDIYLPEWLARHNQRIFGSLYAIGVAYLLVTYLGAGSG